LLILVDHLLSYIYILLYYCFQFSFGLDCAILPSNSVILLADWAILLV